MTSAPALREDRCALPGEDLPLVRPLLSVHGQERRRDGPLPRLRAVVHANGALEHHLLRGVREDEEVQPDDGIQRYLTISAFLSMLGPIL